MKLSARWSVVVLVAAGCASGPQRPSSLEELSRMMNGPVAREVARDAPEAFAEVTRSARQARELQGSRADDAVAETQLLLEWAQAQSREVRARRRRDEAHQRLEAAEADTQRIETQTTALEAESTQREAARARAARVAVTRANPAAVPVVQRPAAAAELRQQAALLLAAAELLGADAAALRAARERLTASERVAPRGQGPTDALTAAAGAYTAAEQLLAAARASRPTAANAPDGGRVTEALSQAGGMDPRRDARGVIAVLRGLFVGGALAPTANTRVESLARVLRAHADTRIRVEVFVGGAVRAAAEATALGQAQALARGLAAAGVPAERMQSAGLYRAPGGSRDNDRAEVVLVLPTEP